MNTGTEGGTETNTFLLSTCLTLPRASLNTHGGTRQDLSFLNTSWGGGYMTLIPKTCDGQNQEGAHQCT